MADPAKRSKEEVEKAIANLDAIALRAFGTKHGPRGRRLLDQTLRTTRVEAGGDQTDAILAIVRALEAIKPQDELERMLAAQMVATHEQAMECLRRATFADQTFAGRELNLKHAEKLLQIYARQVDALDRHRGKGQQKITVEHVTVEAGGQAIVGNVATKTQKPAVAPAPGVLEHKPDHGVPLDLAPARKDPILAQRVTKPRSK